MYRKKDFLFMKVNNITGEKIGFIKDIIIDFNFGIVKGFSIASYRIFQKATYILKEDIVSFFNNMIVKKHRKGKLLQLKDLYQINVIDIKGNILGMVEDIIFNEDSFIITGVIVNTGYINNFLHGKKVFLMKDLILGEKNILYCGEKGKIIFASIPSKFLIEDECYDKENNKK